MLTTQLRLQHAEIAALLGAIDTAQRTGKPGHDLRKLLIDLNSKVTIHLAAEDRMVYPQLQSSQDAAVAAMAKRYASEMGGLAEAFKAFIRTYPTGETIDASRAAFAKGFADILAAIAARVKTEEAELYLAVDSLAKG